MSLQFSPFSLACYHDKEPIDTEKKFVIRKKDNILHL